VEEAKRYAANCVYELSDITAAALKLVSTKEIRQASLPFGGAPLAGFRVLSPLPLFADDAVSAVAAICGDAQASPEWSSAKDPLPVPLAPGGSIYGVPYDDKLFETGTAAVTPAAAAGDSSASARVASIMGRESEMDTFINSFAGRPDLNVLLHEPALKKGSSSAEQMPVQLLRQFQGALHIRSPDSSIEGFLTRLPSISAAGLAAPAADRLVRPELAEVYLLLAADMANLSGKLPRPAAAGSDAVGTVTAVSPQLRLQHFSQVTFGRLDLAWQAAMQQQQDRL
jgi:hypothetical protein